MVCCASGAVHTLVRLVGTHASVGIATRRSDACRSVVGSVASGNPSRLWSADVRRTILAVLVWLACRLCPDRAARLRALERQGPVDSDLMWYRHGGTLGASAGSRGAERGRFRQSRPSGQ